MAWKVGIFGDLPQRWCGNAWTLSRGAKNSHEPKDMHSWDRLERHKRRSFEGVLRGVQFSVECGSTAGIEEASSFGLPLWWWLEEVLSSAVATGVLLQPLLHWIGARSWQRQGWGQRLLKKSSPAAWVAVVVWMRKLVDFQGFRFAPVKALALDKIYGFRWIVRNSRVIGHAVLWVEVAGNIKTDNGFKFMSLKTFQWCRFTSDCLELNWLV